MSYADRSETKMYSGGAMFGVMGGYGAYRAIGPAAWIPTVLAVGSFFLISKLLKRNVAVKVVAALLIAQLGWMVAALLLQPASLPVVGIDLAVDVLLTALILYAPIYVSTPLTIAWTILGIYLVSQQIGTGDAAADRALYVHGALRVGTLLGVAAMIIFKLNPDLVPDDEDEDYDAEGHAG